MGTLIFRETGSQYPIDVEGIENIAREYPVTQKETNGSMVQFWVKGESPAFVIVPLRSDAYDIMQAAYLRDRK